MMTSFQCLNIIHLFTWRWKSRDWWTPDVQAPGTSSSCPAPPWTQSLWPLPLWQKLLGSQSWVLQILNPWLIHSCSHLSITHYALSLLSFCTCMSAVCNFKHKLAETYIELYSALIRSWKLFRVIQKTWICPILYVFVWMRVACFSELLTFFYLGNDIDSSGREV